MNFTLRQRLKMKIGEMVKARWILCGCFALIFSMMSFEAGAQAKMPTCDTIRNQAPHLAFELPNAGFRFTAGGNLVVKIRAFDADGTISKVELFSPFIDNGAVQTLSSAPFSYVFVKLPSAGTLGYYTLVARAFDNRGESTEISTIVFEEFK